MEKQLIVKKVACPAIEASEVPALLDKAGVEFQAIDCVDWAADYPYAPSVSFRVVHTGKEMLVEYKVEEDSVASVAGHDNGKVWEDSCCEFFSTPEEGGPYYNMECNCTGTLLIGCGPCRKGREHAPEDVMQSVKRWSSLGRDSFEERVEKTNWHMALVIPAKAFYKSGIQYFDGMRMKGNFYKCGDKLQKPHFLSWNPILVERPDFHRPDFFGLITFDDNE